MHSLNDLNVFIPILVILALVKLLLGFEWVVVVALAALLSGAYRLFEQWPTNRPPTGSSGGDAAGRS